MLNDGSLDGILKGFNKTIQKLEQLSTKRGHEVKYHSEESVRHINLASSKEAEAKRADEIAERLRELIGE